MARVVGESRLRQRRRRRHWLLLGAGFAGAALLIALLVGLTWLPFLRIKTVEVSGEKTVTPANIERVARGDLAGGYAHLFAKSNIFLYPRSAIEHDLLAQFPMLASASVHAKTFSALQIDVVERQPAALWCGEAAATSSSCYLLDSSGIVYAPAVVYSGDAYQRYYGGAQDAALPWQFLPPQQFRSLIALVTALAQMGHLAPQAISVDASGDVRLACTSGFTLLFSLSDNAGDVLERFSLALTADPFTTHRLSDFEYLDLRFGDKLFYKLK